MNTKTQQKTNQLKHLINVENDEIEKMTYEQLTNFANEITCFRNEIMQVLESNEKLSEIEDKFLYEYSTIDQRNNLMKSYSKKFTNFRFLDLYSIYRSKLENEYKVDNNYKPLDEKALKRHLSNFSINELIEFYNDWNDSIFRNDELNKDPDKLKIAIKKEVNKQLIEFKNDLKENNKVINTDDLINSEYFMLILHSKWVCV